MNPLGRYHIEREDILRGFAPKKVVALTGAGISVASGISPFRGPGGLWEKYDPEEVANIENFRRNPRSSWVMLKEVLEVVEKALPNSAHLSLARMEKKGFISSVITQNIDGLHQKAGNKTVIEYHGNTTRLVCLSCSALFSYREIDLGSLPPYCPACGGVLKPDAVFFGEPIPKAALLQAHAEAQQCRVMLVIGTSGMVQPAAGLPFLAKKNGARIIEVNPERSYLTSSVTDIFLQGKAEEILPIIDEWLNG
ncbi:MAG: NAD-dependent deacylase [Firmicutes bacterium]|jgi:NAD-dependent deacetylase|nr:NAD-dependent deacylase [Bacillota bacterium]